MLTIKTKPDYTLGFIKYTEIKMHPSLPDGLYYYESQLEGGKDIGKLSEITEEQARELVEEGHHFYGSLYKIYYSENSGLLQPYHMNDGEPAWFSNAINSLQSAAEEVGIKEEEFDQYLVIKL